MPPEVFEQKLDDPVVTWGTLHSTVTRGPIPGGPKIYG